MIIISAILSSPKWTQNFRSIGPDLTPHIIADHHDKRMGVGWYTNTAWPDSSLQGSTVAASFWNGLADVLYQVSTIHIENIKLVSFQSIGEDIQEALKLQIIFFMCL
jgi:hypothetical protein